MKFRNHKMAPAELQLALKRARELALIPYVSD